jgi:hypothetical protein
MSNRRVVMSCRRKGRPPFLGRQIRQEGSRAFDRFFAFAIAGSHMKISECPKGFRRILRKVFQGIQVAKQHLAQTAADIFNQARKKNNQAIDKFLAYGLQAVSCKAVGDKLVLQLIAVSEQPKFVTLCDVPAAFVAR